MITNIQQPESHQNQTCDCIMPVFMQIKFCLLNNYLAMVENEHGFAHLSYTVLRLCTESYQLLDMTLCMLHAYW
jgi:hypothetical protein